MPGQEYNRQRKARLATPGNLLSAFELGEPAATVDFVPKASLLDRRPDVNPRGVPGTAVAMTRTATLEFAIDNISTSGMLLVGRQASQVGDRVRLLIHVEGEPSLGISAEVVEINPREGGYAKVAVAFREPDPAIRQRVYRLVLLAIRRGWISASPAVLVIADDPTIADRVEHEVAVHGLVAAHASTALGVVERLQDPAVPIGCALVAAQLARVNTFALLGLLAEEYPCVRRVMLLRRGLTASDEPASTRANSLVSVPWQPDALLTAIGLPFPRRLPSASTKG